MAKERTGRSDKGVVAFMHDFFREALGLSEDMSNNIIARIKERGEWASMKKHVRSLHGDTYKRFNLALDMAEEQKEEEAAPKEKMDAEEKPEEKSPEKKEDKPKEKAEEKKEEVKESFMSYLLNEVTARDVAQSKMDIAGEKPERLKRARMGDPQLRKELQKDFEERTKSDDPLDRQIAQVEKRLALLRMKKKQASGQGEGM